MRGSDLLLALTLGVLIGTLAAVIGVTVFHHVWTRRRNQQEAELAEEIRPRLMEMLLEDEPDLSLFETEQGLRSRLIDDLAAALISKLRGADRQRLVLLLDRRGALDRARRRLSSRRPSVRARAVQLLGSTGAPGALPDLVSLLRDRNRTVREVATRSVGRLGDPSATCFLLALLATPERSVPEHLVRMALFRLGRPAIPNLIRELGHYSSDVRRCAADVLGHLGAAEAVEPLTKLALLDDDVAMEALAAIDRIDGPTSADALRKLNTETSSAELRAAVAAALERRGEFETPESEVAATPVERVLAVGNG
ncbi:MAG: HEAT repeat domain-containing protein [Acidimicrobiia bacterium]|nr:HEAT repeat domain-containing protein [Acidimicrobiia bacterium]